MVRWHITKEAEDAQRRALGLPEETGPSTRQSLEIQAYDELFFPGLAAEWVKCDVRRPFVGGLTLELPMDADDEVSSWIAAGSPPIYFGFGSSVRVAFPADARRDDQRGLRAVRRASVDLQWHE